MYSVAPTVLCNPLLLALDAHSPVPGSPLHVSCRPHLGIAGEEGLVASPSLADWPVRVGPLWLSLTTNNSIIIDDTTTESS